MQRVGLEKIQDVRQSGFGKPARYDDYAGHCIRLVAAACDSDSLADVRIEGHAPARQMPDRMTSQDAVISLPFLGLSCRILAAMPALRFETLPEQGQDVCSTSH
jgi:hypothetical protein